MAAVSSGTARIDWEIAQGATASLNLTWTVGGTPVDLTGYTARCTVKDTYGGTAWLTLTSAGGAIVLGGAAGTIVVTATATQTAALAAPANGVFDVELVSGTTVRRLVAGSVTVTPEVTT